MYFFLAEKENPDCEPSTEMPQQDHSIFQQRVCVGMYVCGGGWVGGGVDTYLKRLACNEYK